MKGGLRSRLKKALIDIVKLKGSPSYLARSFAIGMFISLNPFYGTHTATTMILIPLLRLQAFSALVGTMLNPPWIAPFFYAAAFATGRFLLGYGADESTLMPRSLNELKETLVSWEGFWSLFLPFLLGCTLLGAVVSVAAYFIMKKVIIRFRREKISDDENSDAEPKGTEKKKSEESINADDESRYSGNEGSAGIYAGVERDAERNASSGRQTRNSLHY